MKSYNLLSVNSRDASLRLDHDDSLGLDQAKLFEAFRQRRAMVADRRRRKQEGLSASLPTRLSAYQQLEGGAAPIGGGLGQSCEVYACERLQDGDKLGCGSSNTLGLLSLRQRKRVLKVLGEYAPPYSMQLPEAEAGAGSGTADTTSDSGLSDWPSSDSDDGVAAALTHHNLERARYEALGSEYTASSVGTGSSTRASAPAPAPAPEVAPPPPCVQTRDDAVQCTDTAEKATQANPELDMWSSLRSLREHERTRKLKSQSKTQSNSNHEDSCCYRGSYKGCCDPLVKALADLDARLRSHQDLSKSTVPAPQPLPPPALAPVADPVPEDLPLPTSPKVEEELQGAHALLNEIEEELNRVEEGSKKQGQVEQRRARSVRKSKPIRQPQPLSVIKGRRGWLPLK